MKQCEILAVIYTQYVTCCVQTCGWLNLLANMIDNFTHGLAVAGSFSVGIKVFFLFIVPVEFLNCVLNSKCSKLHNQRIIQRILAWPQWVGSSSTSSGYKYRWKRNGKFCIIVGRVTRTAT